MAFSPDGRTLAAGSAFEGTVKLWDLPRRQRSATLVTHGTS
jgi:WD40 repeat protein